MCPPLGLSLWPLSSTLLIPNPASTAPPVYRPVAEQQVVVQIIMVMVMMVSMVMVMMIIEMMIVIIIITDQWQSNKLL